MLPANRLRIYLNSFRQPKPPVMKPLCTEQQQIGRCPEQLVHCLNVPAKSAWPNAI
jgi:hypothetical protein